MKQYFAERKDKNVLYFNHVDINHIKNVLRSKEDDLIYVIYDNKRYVCKLDKSLLSASIIKEEDDTHLHNEIIFYIPITTEEKMDLVLQKGTELGVTHFIPTEYEHCKFKLNDSQKEKKLIRWEKIVKSASEQSHRITVPKIEHIIKCKNVVARNGVNIVCSLDNNDVKPIKEVLTSSNVYDTISVLYGPEGGLTKEEENYFSSLGYQKTSLCNTVLRTETVIIYVSSVIEYLKSGV